MFLLSANIQELQAQTPNFEKNKTLLQAMRWRCVGPFRGGRSLAVAGHSSQPNIFYFGAVGGGVWKSNDAGNNWSCISDSTFTSSSIGAIAVAPSNANVIYVGTGESEIRGNISYGDGMYKSIDGGKSWQFIGLKETYSIGTLAVHPKDENTVFAAALGNVFMPNSARGIYKTTDGGKNWRLVLAKNDSTGAANIIFDPNDSNILYASLWQCYRNPYSMSSGGKGSGLYRSTDGGETWKNISTNVGLPKGILGKISVAVAPSNSERVWAMIENENGGLFRSDNGGTTWTRINEEKKLRQRPWYFSQIFAHPQDDQILYVLNVNMWKSVDGGKTFQNVSTNHVDYHDLWINPMQPDVMIVGNDGGAEVSLNGGQTWSEPDVPTAQFYHLQIDDHFPYRLYGAQQDNTSVRLLSRNISGYAISKDEWEPSAGGEAGYITPHRTQKEVVFGGEYDGYLSKYDHQTKQNYNISLYPISTIGHGAVSKKYRFQWTYPIVFSRHDNSLFITSQFVHRSKDEGMSFETISPDLTRNDSTKQQASGGLITKDNTSVEVYNTIFTFAESPRKAGIFWTGSDDGLIHISQDDGKTWKNVSPPHSLLPEWSLISMIDASSEDEGTCFVAANRYKHGDMKPYLLKTIDFGKTWQRIDKGLPNTAYCRVVRQDPLYPNLLYAGTEKGIFISLDKGNTWQSLQLNLPLTPIHDLQIHAKEKDLVIATHGRSFWILDNLMPLHELAGNYADIQKSDFYLYTPRPAYRVNGGGGGVSNTEGENPPNAVQIYYHLKMPSKKELKMQFCSEKGDTIATYSSQKDRKGKAVEETKDFYIDKDKTLYGVLTNKSGQNLCLWDMRYNDATAIAEGEMLLWGGSIRGGKAVPGNYVVKLFAGDSLVAQRNFSIQKNPTLSVSDADYAEQRELSKKVTQKLSETHQTINDLRQIRKQINAYTATVEDTSQLTSLKKTTKPLLERLDKVESTLIQHKAKAFQELLNYPVCLNNQLASINSAINMADSRPTAQMYTAFDDISQAIDVQIAAFKKIIDTDIPALNQQIQEFAVPTIRLKKAK